MAALTVTKIIMIYKRRKVYFSHKEIWVEDSPGGEGCSLRLKRGPGSFYLIAATGLSLSMIKAGSSLYIHVSVQWRKERGSFLLRTETLNCTLLCSHFPEHGAVAIPSCKRGWAIVSVWADLWQPKLREYVTERKKGRL